MAKEAPGRLFLAHYMIDTVGVPASGIVSAFPSISGLNVFCLLHFLMMAQRVTCLSRAKPYQQALSSTHLELGPAVASALRLPLLCTLGLGEPAGISLAITLPLTAEAGVAFSPAPLWQLRAARSCCTASAVHFATCKFNDSVCEVVQLQVINCGQIAAVTYEPVAAPLTLKITLVSD